MWRRLSNLRGNPDSDQSISEEEDVDVSLEENDDDMLGPSEKTKEEGRGLLLQTKLEKLIGGCGGELNHAQETGYVSLEATPRKISSSLEQVPDSPEDTYFPSSTSRDGFICISAAHETVPYDEMPPVAIWATISKEAKSLLHLNGIASLSSPLRAKRGSKVVKDNNVRPKFSFHSHAHGETSIKISDMAEYFEPVDDQAAIEEDPITECPNSFDEISDNTEDAAVSNLLVPPPPDKIRVTTKRSSKSYSRSQVKCFKFAHKGSVSNIQDSDSDDELDSSGSSTDDEPSYQTSVPDISNQKKQFVGDLFNEAVKASSLNKEGLSFDSPKLSGGSSLYGKLQQMMKQEKETETVITKKLEGGNGEADATWSSIDIKIKSRHLEGKLMVCKCSVIDLPGESLLFKKTQALAAKETETRVIFNPKVCADVDIEVGSFVRVHAPWKEVEVKKSKEVIIICSYFSSL